MSCPTREVFTRVGERWTALVILALTDGPLRFNALRQAVDGVTQKMLTQTLRSMERDGFVTRTVTPTVPVSVEYELVPLGHRLATPITELHTWAYQHISDIPTARISYDRSADRS
ncbi:winged helix-turn-helix transcriptional regulator [Devriesea agamarum]|uniref:winged helix-turn-helix transcriptional regulator n=1 Tax=Devriesea agamarum TaxID=472569 RepID=UPI00071D0F7F|nr:helix-turn-helix domain-containing protein [Devriesea agamarum]